MDWCCGLAGGWLCGVDLSGGDDVKAWVVEGIDGGFITGSPGFAESSEKTSQTVSHSFSISATMFLASLKGEVVNAVWEFEA